MLDRKSKVLFIAVYSRSVAQRQVMNRNVLVDFTKSGTRRLVDEHENYFPQLKSLGLEESSKAILCATG